MYQVNISQQSVPTAAQLYFNKPEGSRRNEAVTQQLQLF